MITRFYLLLFLLTIFLQSCNTLYNSSTINLEIVEPAKVIFPAGYNKIAVRYNNINVDYNPLFAKSNDGAKVITDPTNSDSIASEIYYNSFFESISDAIIFDTITKIKPSIYSNTHFDFSEVTQTDSAQIVNAEPHERALFVFSEIHKQFIDSTKKAGKSIKIDPEYGLYSKSDLKQIADTTGAALLLSFDFFGVVDEYNNIGRVKYKSEYVIAFWSFYDLYEKNLRYFYNRIDTVSWISTPEEYMILPSKNEAVMNAADIVGERFSNFLTPHWIDVNRTIYKSGHIEMKQAEKLAEENKWLEAAEIWKKNANNPNNKIAAKSMYNMALACEINGQLDAALDWLVRSYHVFGQKNKVHEFNCRDYIRILGQRKVDFKKIDLQFNPE